MSVEQKVRIVDVDGVFDEAAAAAISAKLLEPGWDVVIVDFHGAREVSEIALFLIASAAGRERSPAVMLRGLGHHHQRVLRYLDVNVADVDVDDRRK